MRNLWRLRKRKVGTSWFRSISTSILVISEGAEIKYRLCLRGGRLSVSVLAANGSKQHRRTLEFTSYRQDGQRIGQSISRPPFACCRRDE